ncbi:MAG TPA: hypothetical protein VGI45_18830 [Terracidiphilus sp.]|jgi:hypothetical protein
MNLFTRKSLSVIASIVLISAIAVFAAQYRQYAYAMAWHYRHHASFRLGEHEIEIPNKWWAGAKADGVGRISIFRASKSSVFFEPKIEVGPASPGEMAQGDDEQSSLANKVVAAARPDPQSGWTFSVTTLRSRNSTWYCLRDADVILGKEVLTNLTCNASRVPYTLNYQGPPEQEKEAELIFATFR